jgi:hypothetical protein
MSDLADHMDKRNNYVSEEPAVSFKLDVDPAEVNR